MTNTNDTGLQLRFLYEETGGVTEIFSSKVADYIMSRPDYPEALFDTLAKICEPGPESIIADVGAGTGLLTHGLLARGYRVTAVEPNDPMRKAADHWLGDNPWYNSVAGSAETTTIPPGSVDLITAAQAFHWFDIEKTREEFLRILSPSGKVVLIWNHRVAEDPLHIALDKILTVYGDEKRHTLITHEQRKDVPEFFGGARPVEMQWSHVHRLDEDGLACLVFSRSYIPGRETDAGREILRLVKDVYREHAEGGRVAVHYTTIAIIGRPE